MKNSPPPPPPPQDDEYELQLHVPTAPTEDEMDVEHDQVEVENEVENEDENEVENENDDDLEHHRQAERHRRQARAMVREHLETHVSNNPGASSDYVTWIATLHPENAEIAIDRRFFVPGNPWWTIYEDTKNNRPIPFAKAVPVSNNRRDTTSNTAATCTTTGPSKDVEAGGAAAVEDCDETSEESSSDHDVAPNGSRWRRRRTQGRGYVGPPHFCLTCNPIGMVCGLAISLPALVVVLSLELVALLVFHLPATLFYRCARAFAPPNICTCFLYLLFSVFRLAFSLGDSVLLLGSVLATECLGLAALVLGFATGGCLWAAFLHQNLRKTCHGLRVAFRRNNNNNSLPSHRSARVPSRNACGGTACLTRTRSNPNLRGVTVIDVRRVRRPGESCH